LEIALVRIGKHRVFLLSDSNPYFGIQIVSNESISAIAPQLSFMLFLAPALCACARFLSPRGAARSPPPVQYFSQIVDHASPDSSGTFLQRYFEVNISSPADRRDVAHAILAVGGESDDFAGSVRGVTDFIATLAGDLNAPVFTLEHRYFGSSFPADSSTANYSRLLSVGQALADLRNFALQTAAARSWGAGTKWLIVGRSYSGMLSALARQAFPEVFHAALSSSGVVLATDNFTDFDLQVAAALGEECAAVARAARLRIERIWESGPAGVAWILSQFGAEDLQPNATDFLFLLGDIFTIGPQYADRAALCGPLLDAARTQADPIIALARYTRDVFIPVYNGGDILSSYSRARMLADAGKTENCGGRSWMWMTCNELAFWQVSPGRLSIRPRNLTQTWYSEQCKDIFGEGHSWPDVEAFNRKYNGLQQNASRVFYSTGSQDPWTWVCVTDESGAPKGSVAHTVTGPEIGHCRDWDAPANDDPPDVVKTHESQRRLFRQWMAEDEP
jgi:pimeloyl-ACP methyl ester carboxylesterase